MSFCLDAIENHNENMHVISGDIPCSGAAAISRLCSAAPRGSVEMCPRGLMTSDHRECTNGLNIAGHCVNGGLDSQIAAEMRFSESCNFLTVCEARFPALTGLTIGVERMEQ